MSEERRAMYKPVPLLVTSGRSAEPFASHQPAVQDQLHDDEEKWHDAKTFSFSSIDNVANRRFTNNFVSPPLHEASQQQDVPDLVDLPLLSEITSETTEGSQLSSDYSELATIMQSVTNQLGQMSATGASKQKKQIKKKKQKKGRVVPSRYMASVKTKTVEDSASVKPSKSNASAATGKRSVRARSPSVSQQIMLDSALPKSGTFNTSAVISSTPAVVEEDGTSSHDTGAIHDGNYIAASNVPVSTSTATNSTTTEQATHHTSGSEEEELSREEFISLRCCALQWAYLDAMTTKAFKQQEEQAKAQIHQLHSSLMKKMDDIKVLENEIASIEHQMAVDATLHSQLQELGAVAAHLPEVEPQYKKMAQSLDNTRHLMNTDEVTVPSEDELLMTLRRSVELMDKLSSFTNAPQVAELAETDKAVEDVTASLEKAVESNKILEQELEDLHIEEESLRYQVKLIQELYNIEDDN